MFVLQRIEVSTRLPFQEAQQLAQEHLTGSKTKTFFTKTKRWYKFRNVTKKQCVPNSFKKKKIGKDIVLVYGKTCALEGDGLLSVLKPRSDRYNNLSRKTLKQFGDKAIKSLTLVRTPIPSMLNKALNFVSLGKWNNERRKYGFDTLYHLALLVSIEGGKSLVVEKNEVINISTSYRIKSTTEQLTLPLPTTDTTLNTVLDITRKRMGDKKYFLYDAFNNNCQVYIKNVLESMDLYSSEAKNFLFQNVEEMAKNIPSYVKKFAHLTTSAAATVDKLSGRGVYKLSKDNMIKEGKGMPDHISALSELLFKPDPIDGKAYKHNNNFTLHATMPAKATLQKIVEASYKPDRDRPDVIGKYRKIMGTDTLAFYQHDHVIMLGVRGTADTRDMKADTLIALGKLTSSMRYKKDLQDLVKFQEQYPVSQYTYFGVSHSLGGALVDKFLALGKLKQAVSYNPAVEKKDLLNTNHLRIYWL